VACARPEIDDPVRVRHYRKVMLDDDHRLGRIDQPVEQPEQQRGSSRGCRPSSNAHLVRGYGGRLVQRPLAAEIGFLHVRLPCAVNALEDLATRGEIFNQPCDWQGCDS